MGRAELGRNLKVAAHPHRQDGKSVSRGEFGQQREMRARRLAGGRNAHEALNRKTALLPAIADEGVGVFRKDPGLLRFGAGVDLNEKTRAAVLAAHFLGDRSGDFRAVEAFDDVEERDRVRRLVRLQGPDEMEFNVRKLGAQRRPFRLRFLDAVFPENAMAGGERLADRRRRNGFRDRDDLDRAVPSCFLQRGVDPRTDRGEAGFEIGWRMIVGHEGLRAGAAKLAAAASALKRASLRSGGAAAPFSLAFLTDRRRIPEPEPILRALPAGAAVIYRDYDDPKRAAVAARYASICKGRGVFFLVAGDLALARRVGADGAHMPSRMLRGAQRPFNAGQEAPARTAGADAGQRIVATIRLVSDADKDAKPFVIAIACHSAGDLALAAAIGADLALLSPVFPTKSHPYAEHLGPARFKALAVRSLLPVLALGGVDAENARLLAGRNVAGIAAIGAFQGRAPLL